MIVQLARDVRILKFWVRVRKVPSAFASALSAIVIMFKTYWNPGTVFNNVAKAKSCKCNWNFVVLGLQLLSSAKTTVGPNDDCTPNACIANCDQTAQLRGFTINLLYVGLDKWPTFVSMI